MLEGMAASDGHTPSQHREILRRIARRVMLEHGLLTDFPPPALAELDRLDAPAALPGPGGRDLRGLPWCSIDNDDSRDLDQLTVASALPGGETRILVAVADVHAFVGRGSALDGRARHNPTSVYTPAETFPMLPERLSTDISSLNPDEDRPAVVVGMRVGADGSLADSEVFGAAVRNRAKLAYGPVGDWLEGRGPVPPGVASLPGLAENLRMQDAAARAMRELRHRRGALDLDTMEARAVFTDGSLDRLEPQTRNRARELI